MTIIHEHFGEGVYSKRYASISYKMNSFIVKYYDDGSTQQPTSPQLPTAPPNTNPFLQTAPPQTNYSPGVQPPGWQNTQPFDPNQGNLGILPGGSHFDESSNNPYQGIASLAGTNPGI